MGHLCHQWILYCVNFSGGLNPFPCLLTLCSTLYYAWTFGFSDYYIHEIRFTSK